MWPTQSGCKRTLTELSVSYVLPSRGQVSSCMTTPASLPNSSASATSPESSMGLGEIGAACAGAHIAEKKKAHYLWKVSTRPPTLAVQFVLTITGIQH